MRVLLAPVGCIINNIAIREYINNNANKRDKKRTKGINRRGGGGGKTEKNTINCNIALLKNKTSWPRLYFAILTKIAGRRDQSNQNLHGYLREKKSNKCTNVHVHVREANLPTKRSEKETRAYSCTKRIC